MISAAAFVLLALTAAPPPEPAAAGAASDSVRRLIFFAESRPIFVRLRVTSRGQPFDGLWADSNRTLHTSLDRNGDGKLTTKEADPKIVTALIRLATGAAVPPAVPELDVNPKDGNVSVDELAEALRPLLGPFHLQIGRQAIGRTDALFDQLDRDKDGELTRPELAAIAGSLRPLDLDDNEMISPDEVEPYNSSASNVMMDESAERRARLAAVPPVVEIIAGESSLRLARLLLRKYDKGKGDVPGRPDGKLSSAEFAIDPEAFASADRNNDDSLDTDELRKLIVSPPSDLTLEVELSPEASSRARVLAEAGAPATKGTSVRRLAEGDVEYAVGGVRLDIHVDDGASAGDAIRRAVEQRFKGADVNKNGYLEGKELAAINGPGSPFAGLSEVIDRDSDGKIYLKELVDFTDRQHSAARARLVVTTADQARAIFGIVDLDRDRRLGAREVMRTVDRVMSWDANGDSRVSPDEIPYHFQVNIARSGLNGLIGEGMFVSVRQSIVVTPTNVDVPAAPDWFQKMDRNHDGDVSRREFLGPREQFDRLDADKDGLIDADEAKAAAVATTKLPPQK
jgi:Ca2+-binding EF-hand superfamily protein